ncbi:MAG: isoprenylcysteine carboxylmethyltransferase family protein [Pyrinomonadaceae bacterium]
MIKFDKRFLQRVRIPLGFLFAIVFMIFARPTSITLLIGGVIAVVGVAIRAWASGHIRKARVLAISGPYAYTRNPLYVGSFILGVGFTIAAGVWWLALIFCALFIGIYMPVMRVEANDLRGIFGEVYERYEAAVPLFIPRLSVWQRTDEDFDLQLYLQYREYRAAVGFAVAMLVLAAKAYFSNNL